MSVMTDRRAIREFAFQLLYLLDARGGDGDLLADAIEAGPSTDDDLVRADGSLDRDGRSEAAALAQRAYEMREEADRLASELAPKWPTSRQPAVDRALLRLGWCEMKTGHAPPRAAINEAVELAKRFSTERSPAFINGVLDKMMRRMQDDEPATVEPTEPPPPGDAWLADALNGPAPAESSE